MRLLKKILLSAFIILSVAVVSVCVVWQCVEPFYIPSVSMQPTLLPGDVVWVNKFKSIHDYKRGDIIVFRSHEKDDQKIYIKRIVGLPQDRLRIEDEKIYIHDVGLNQTPVVVSKRSEPFSCFVDLKEEYKNILDSQKMTTLPYAQGYKNYTYLLEENQGKTYWIQYENKKMESEADSSKEWIVPENSFFVLGDHRTNSEDSRLHGFVRFSDVIGVADSIWFSMVHKAYACGEQYLKAFDIYLRSSRSGLNL